MKTRHQHWIAPTFIAQREKERTKETESAFEKDGKSILTELRRKYFYKESIYLCELLQKGPRR